MRMSTLLNEVKEIEEKLLSERVTSTAFRKKTARVNPMTQKDIERMVSDRKYKGNTSALMKDVKKKFPDEYESDIVQDMMKKHAETNEKKEVNEDGHTDVASAIRQCKIMIEDAMQISSKLQGMNPEESLPSWWTNKLAISSNSMNKLRDYFLVPTTEEVELDEAMYHHVLKNKVVASGSKSDMMKLVKKTGATVRKGPDTNYVLNSPGAKVGDIKEEILDEAQEDIFIKKGDTKKIAAQVAKNARGLGLRSASVGASVRVIGPKKKVSDFLRTVIGRSSTGDATTSGMTTDMTDKLLKKAMNEESVEIDEASNVTMIVGNIDDPKSTAATMNNAHRSPSFKGVKFDAKPFGKDSIKVTGDANKIKDFIKMAYGRSATFKQVKEETLEEAPKMKYALVGKDMKIYSMGSDERDLKLDRRSLEKRFKDVAPLKLARLKTAQSIGDTVDKSQLKEEVNEMAYKPGSFKDTKPQEKGAKALADLAKTGGMDKKDFEKARALYVQASDPASREKLKKFIGNLDTDPLEQILDVIGRNDPNTFLQMYPNAKEGEPLTRTAFKHRSMKSEELEEKYDLYHKDFSSAMQHAYDYAKKKMGITVDPKEIDNKVATGPKKPSEGKTNTYKLKGKGGNLQIQVYNKGGSKPFELNMYKEELELIEQVSNIRMGYQTLTEKVDPADVDNTATDKDIENAGKNIIMQLRKSVSMRGNKDVEFADGKKKVDMRIAQKAIDMHMKMRTSDDKLKFQNSIAKSYKDLLNTVKGK